MPETIKTDRWRDEVLLLLTGGLGVEDIALKLECSSQVVREEIETLRKDNVLVDIYGGSHED